MKCPNCNSTNIIGWKQELETRKYKLDKDGNFTDEQIGFPYPEGTFTYGYECVDCNSTFNYNWEQIGK